MDSISNLPLLEIAGEDDSLLFDVSAASTTDVFSCSPLLPLRSNPPQHEGREGGGAVDSENQRSSSVSDRANKENADWNTLQKLSLEPQQMKRKKKGGGYNLRVLNPAELSIISGTATPKAGLNLEVILEEESVGTSIELQDIEENLFMHSSDAVPVEDRKIGLSPKPAALAKASPAPVSKAKRKVLTVNDSVGNRSKRNACPPRVPVASSSLKKTDTVKAPSKELKVTRIPGPKSDVSASATTARSGMLTTGSLKRNQNARPATNLQKHTGVKGPSKNPKTVPSNPKVGLAGKCSVTRTLTQQAGKHLDNSVSETHPPSRMHQSGTEANKVSEACLSQGVSDISEKRQQTQLQTTKFSGLRMPSPSLGFFSLAKTSSSHSQLQKSSKPCKPARSNIPQLQNLETNSVNEARLPHAPGIRSQIVKGAAKNCTEELTLLDVKSESRMQVDNKQMAGVEVEHNSMGSEKISKQEKVENNLEHVNIKPKEQGELHRSENASSMENVIFPRHEKKLLSVSQTQEQSEKEAGHPDVLSNKYQSVFQEPQSMDHHGMLRNSIMTGSISNTVHNAMGQDEDEQIKLFACDVLTSNESLVLQAKHGTSFKGSRLSEEFKEYNSVKTAFLNSSLVDLSETVLGGSIQEIPFKNTEQVNGDAADFVTSGGDAQVHLLNANLSVDCNESTESNLEAVNQQLQGEQLKTTSAGIVGEISSSKEDESHVNSCQLVHMTTLSSKGSPQKSIPEINGPAETEPKIAEIEDCQFPVDDQSGFIQTRPELEGCEKVIDSKAMHDSSQAFELDSLSEDCVALSAPACNTVVSNVSWESRPFQENNVEILHFTSQLCPVVKVDFDPSKNEMSTNSCRMISELQLGDEDSSRDVSMHYDVPIDVPGNFEQQINKNIYSKASEMLCEGESLVLNHGHLLDQSEFSEELSADFISNTKDSISTVAGKSSGCLQHTLPAQLSVLLDGDWLPTNTASSEEIKKTNLSESALEGCDIHTSERNASNYHIQAMPEIKDGNIDVDEREELLRIDDSKEGSSDILPLVEAQLNDNVISSECNSSIEVSKDSFTDIVAWKSEEDCSLSQSSNFPASDNLTFNTGIPQKLNQNSPHGDWPDTVSATACDTKVNNVSQESQPCHENDVGDLQFTAQLSPMVKADFDSTENDISTNNCCTISELELRDDGSSRDASMHYDGQCGVTGNFEQQTSMITYSVANEMLCEDESLVLSHDHLVDQSDFSEVSADFVSNAKGSIGSGAENPSGHLQHTILTPLVQEFDHTNRETEESHLENAQVQSFTENPVAYHCSSKHSLVTDDKFPLADNNDINEDSHLSDFQRLGAVVGVDSQNADNILIASSQEIKKTSLSEGALEGCDTHTSEHNASNHHIQAMPKNKEGNLDVDETAELLQIYDAKKGSSDILPIVEVQLKDSQNVDDLLHLDGDWPPTNFVSSEEFKKTNLSEGALEGSDIHSSEHNASNHHIQAMPENKDGNLDVDEREEFLQMDDVKKGSSDILPLVEVQLIDNVVSSKCNSSIEVNKDSVTDVVTWKSEEHCSLSESSNLPALDDLTTFNTRTPQVCEVSSLNSTIFLDEAETDIFEKDEFPHTDMQHQSNGNINSAEDSSKIIRLEDSVTKCKQEVPTVKPPPNAAPFSDEWLAAIEAAGEEILTMKSGAVQNSPPDKPQQEPGPWSPVRRKNQSIGPFDCTKHNIQHSSP
ncbi:hypothetical protein GLYMA_11G150661v4 [Glycine max]|nr:hypothetical protein GLYMA_11G150661v4 [Glycine max]KAH1115966.1 hypothetical protein GYH30_057211 [Glycine max]|eukprot:XP_006591015.1 uncharacterized protein LOC102669351 isoform X3 [Glycine max]